VNFSMGLWATIPAIDEARAEILAALIESDVWGKPLKFFSSNARPGEKLVRRPGALFKRDRAFLRDVLRDPRVGSVHMSAAPLTRGEVDEAHISIDVNLESWECALTMDGRRWLPNSRTQREAWVEAIVTAFDRLGSTQAIILVHEKYSVFSETTLTGYGSSSGGIHHPWPDEFDRVAHLRGRLGVDQIRFPRWGTLLSPAHLERMGGVARIVEVVQPAVVRELSGGTYFQLTDRVATSTSEESLDRQRRFIELAAPLLPPPRTLSTAHGAAAST